MHGDHPSIEIQEEGGLGDQRGFGIKLGECDAVIIGWLAISKRSILCPLNQQRGLKMISHARDVVDEEEECNGFVERLFWLAILNKLSS